MTQARPYLAARSLKGLEVKFEMIEREGGGRKKKSGKLECSLVAAGHRWSNMNLGLKQEVRACTSVRLQICVHTYVHACQHVCAACV